MKADAAKSARSKSDFAGPETVTHRESSTKLALPRTQSAEWFDRGEREAKEAHAAHARAIAKGLHDDHDHDHGSASGTHGTPGARKRAHGMLYPALGLRNLLRRSW